MRGGALTVRSAQTLTVEEGHKYIGAPLEMFAFSYYQTKQLFDRLDFNELVTAM